MPRSSRSQPGCRECSRRRIKCDLTSPACTKCLRKGLKCSGQTKFRFNKGVANRGHLKGYEYAIPQPTAKVRKESALTWHTPVVGAIDQVSPPLPPVLEAPEQQVVISGAIETAHSYEPQHSVLRMSRAIDILPTGVSFLFNHFSRAVAPHMVIFDVGNGWRDFILPLATSNELIQRAVCVTAAQHLTLHRPEVQQRVETQRMRVLEQLLREATSGQALTSSGAASTCLALLVMLVGETVTGGSDFRQIHKALEAFCSAANPSELLRDNEALGTFLMQQFHLFTAFVQPEDAITTGDQLLPRFEEHLAMVPLQQITNPEQAHNFQIVSTALRLAHTLYLASGKAEDLLQMSRCVNELERMCRSINSGAPGEHALVWAYFIGAAESKVQTTRDFFVSRMEAIYKRSGFNNVMASIQMLQLLWNLDAGISWAAILPKLSPVLVM